MTEASWCFLLACLLTPLQRLVGPDSLWPSLSGTGARELDCPSPTTAFPVVVAGSAVAAAAAAAAAAAVAAAAEFGVFLADCH